jgi:hypothetical protein
VSNNEQAGKSVLVFEPNYRGITRCVSVCDRNYLVAKPLLEFESCKARGVRG